jgi:hypothetical protein
VLGLPAAGKAGPRRSRLATLLHVRSAVPLAHNGSMATASPVSTGPPKHSRLGVTRHGLPVYRRTIDHLPAGNPYQRFNRWAAIKVTAGVGTMLCAYIFCVIALIGLPAAWQQSFTGGIHPLPLVQWIAQTFLQLVLLSVIIVGQNITAEASDSRAEKQFDDSEKLVGLQQAAGDLLAQNADLAAGMHVLLQRNTDLTAQVHAVVCPPPPQTVLEHVAGTAPPSSSPAP